VAAGDRRSRSGSWGGVNESQEDLAQAAAAASALNASVATEDQLERLEPEEEDFRRRLAFFFMDPLAKYRARGQFPLKLVLQFLKLVLVTALLVSFGRYRYAHTKYFADNAISLENMFLRNWDSVREINSYPPAAGAYALYSKSAFFAQLDHAASAWANLEKESVNPVFRDGPLTFCVERFARSGTVFPNLTWTIDFGHTRHFEECVALPEERQLRNFSSKDWYVRCQKWL